MSDYSIGDYVLIRGKVIAVHGSDIGYSVELFSKTDQYAATIRPDLVVDRAATPHPTEPDHDSLVVDREGDVWHWGGRGWRINKAGDGKPWFDLEGYGPLKIYERAS